MATEQDIIDATYIKKVNQIKLTIKKALSSLASGNDDKGSVFLDLKFFEFRVD